MLFTFLVLLGGLISTQCSSRSPIVLIPGLSGSQIEAKLNDDPVHHFYCEKKENWFTIWINLGELLPFIINCFSENMVLNYNASSGIFSNVSNVEIRAPGFGNTTTIEYLDPSKYPQTEYMYGLVEPLSKMGYTRGVNIRGAPYDWRLAPDTLVRTGYYQKLLNLIEETYFNNSETPITLVCHSLGCPTILYFLNTQITQDWKERYIHHLVSLSGAWAGSVLPIKSLISGSSFSLPFIDPIHLRNSERTLESTYFLLPSQEVFDDNTPFVSVGSTNYTLDNLDKLILSLNIPNALAIKKQVMPINEGFKDPKVPIFCIHGTSVPTVEHMAYAEDGFPDAAPTMSYGAGDGTVNLVSLETCLKWKDSPGFQQVVVEGKVENMLTLFTHSRQSMLFLK